ncbi:TPA: hypothetical protein ACGX66_002864, partial [Listeria monocytogenes]|nr:hypothetical protein [Listeria monocytogenes]EHS3947084.1 hypothetical protein [Listeria monocytogenes]
IKNFKRRLKSIDSFSGESLPEISNISIDDEFKEMMELFLNAAENNKEQVINKKLEIWFSNNFSNDNDIFFEDEFKVDLFKRANSLNMIDKYLMKSNASLIMIKRALQRIYYPIDNNQEVREQKADIIEFKEKISNSSEKRNNDFIQKQNINEITNFLDEIIKKSEILMEENN